MKARWGYNPKTDCEYIFILGANQTHFKLSRYEAEDLKEEMGGFLAEFEEQTQGRRGQFVVLSRFQDTVKLLSRFNRANYFDDPDFSICDGALVGRYQGDRATRNYYLHLKIPVETSKYDPKDWSGPIMDFNIHAMKGLSTYIRSAIEEMDLKCTE